LRNGEPNADIQKKLDNMKKYNQAISVINIMEETYNVEFGIKDNKDN